MLILNDREVKKLEDEICFFYEVSDDTSKIEQAHCVIGILDFLIGTRSSELSQYSCTCATENDDVDCQATAT